MGRYLGVDGGGTKTAFALIDDDARVIAEATGPTLYSFPADAALIRRVLADGIAALGDVPIDRAFFALPGYGESTADLPVLRRVPGEVLGHDRYAVDNDAVAGWAGSLGGEDGINVVAGTGSIAYGRWQGRSARAGGWSEVFGDEGSGYWIAVRALNAFSRMGDGRMPAGPLQRTLLAATGADSLLDVIGVVSGEWANDRTRIAALSRVVVDAAEAGDAVAAGILAEAGAELASLVGVVRAGLGVPKGVGVRVSRSGGVFSAPAVLAAFTAALGPGYEPVTPLHSPVVGAALLALQGADRKEFR